MDVFNPPIAQDRGPTRNRLAFEGLLILGLSLTLNLAGNGRVGLWDRDEPRYASCTREMRERGDWLFPTFNGQPRYHKPILIYWLMRAGFAVGGDNPFGARLVSAIAGASTSLVVWRLGRSIVGARAGLLASLALATVPIMVTESKLATTDATLTLLIVVAQACLWGLARTESRSLAMGFWVSMALATLLKGPVGWVLVGASGLVSWWWGGPTVCWRRLRWAWGLPLFLGLAAPWYVAVSILSGGEFFRFAVQTQIVQRVSSGMEQHGGFPGYYAVVALPLFFPWSALLPAAGLAAWRRRRADPGLAFLLGWAVGPWIVLECFQTKLIHYYLPAFPACALLVAWLIGEACRSGVSLRNWSLGRMGIRLISILGIGFSLFLISGLVWFPGPLRVPGGLMGLGLGIGTVFTRIKLEASRNKQAAAGLVVTWSVVMSLFVAWFLPAAEPYRLSRVVGTRLAVLSERTRVRPAIMTFQEPGVIYALGRPACDVRGVDELSEEVLRNGPVLVPLLAKEAAEMRADPRFAMEPVELLSGFNVNKGKVQDLEFTVVGPGRSSRLGLAQQPLVK